MGVTRSDEKNNNSTDGDPMKATLIFVAAATLLVLSNQPTLAKCVPLIKEAREQLASAKLSKSDEAKIKTILNEADKLSEAGNHIEGVKKANQALNMLKKN
jgi:hypothetical protein